MVETFLARMERGLAARGAHPALRARWPFVLVAMGGVVLAGLGAAVFHDHALAPGSLLQHLGRGAVVLHGSLVVQGVGRLAPLAPSAVPPCLVAWEDHDTWYRSTVHDGARVTLDDGATYVVPEPERLWFLANEPPPVEPGPELAALARSRAKQLSPGTSARVSCLSATEPVFLQACLRPGEDRALAPCPGDPAIPLVLGVSSRPLALHRLAAAVAWLSLGLGACLTAACAAWWAAHADGARGLAERSGASEISRGPLAGVLVALAALVLALPAWETRHGAFVTFAGLELLAVAVGRAFWCRYRELGAARAAAGRADADADERVPTIGQLRRERRTLVASAIGVVLAGAASTLGVVLAATR